MFKTHLAFGFLIGVLVTQFVNVSYPLIFIALVTLLSGLPDLDTVNSKWGRKFWYVSYPISFIFGHRGFFHSVFPAVGFFLIFYALGFSMLGLAIFFGWMAHLFGDCISKEGVAFFYPISYFRLQGPMRVNSVTESFVFVLILIVDVYLVAKMIHIF